MDKLIFVVGVFNFTVEYILLMAVDRLSGYFSSPWKKLLSSGIVGIYGSLCLLPAWGCLASLAVRWGLLSFLGLLLYWQGGKMLPRLSLMLLMNFGVDGFQRLASQKDLISFAAAGVIMGFICVLCFRDGGSQQYIALELRFQQKHIALTALVDSGNTLCDPVSGEPVVIISHKAATQLTGLSRGQLANPLETLEKEKIPGLRLIPYHSIGRENGLLLALRLKGCKLAGKEKELLVAFAPAGLGKEANFQALIGGQI